MNAAPGTWAWPPRSLLHSLGPAARQRFLALGTMVEYEPDRKVIREADESTFVLILLDGVVKATGRTQDSRDALLAVRVGGDLVGEFGVMDGRPRSATITTCGVVVARLITRDTFLTTLRDDPPIAAAVSASLITKLRASNTRRIEFAGTDAPTRVARIAYDLALTYGEPDGDTVILRWPLTQPELATLIGAAEPTVHKALRELREAGVLSTGYRGFRVNDLERLKQVAYPATASKAPAKQQGPESRHAAQRPE